MKLVIKRENFGYDWSNEDDQNDFVAGGVSRDLKALLNSLDVAGIDFPKEVLKDLTDLEVGDSIELLEIPSPDDTIH